MNKLLLEAHAFLRDGDFEYAICGGFALDLFTGRDMRIHGDIDVCAFEKGKNAIVQHMVSNGWSIYEFQGQGIVRLVNSIKDCQKGRNLMCLKSDCEIVKFYPCGKGDGYFLHKFFHTGITDFNYVEFLFNTTNGSSFIFKGRIKRDLSKAILHRNDIPYLSPELVLLYKASDFEREWYQFDLEETIIAMNDEQKSWFYSSLDKLYPKGHAWRK